MSAFTTVAILIVGVTGYLVMAEAMDSSSVFRYPRIIAALIAVLGCIGLRQLGDDVITAVALPSATLLLMCGVIWFVMHLSDKVKKPAKNQTRIKQEKTPKVVKEPSTKSSHNPWQGGSHE